MYSFTHQLHHIKVRNEEEEATRGKMDSLAIFLNIAHGKCIAASIRHLVFANENDLHVYLHIEWESEN